MDWFAALVVGGICLAIGVFLIPICLHTYRRSSKKEMKTITTNDDFVEKNDTSSVFGLNIYCLYRRWPLPFIS